MSSSYGENIKLTIFGESHSPAIGMVLEGIRAGEKINIDRLNAFMERRAPGRNEHSTARREADVPEFVCGLLFDNQSDLSENGENTPDGLSEVPGSQKCGNTCEEVYGTTCGVPITALIRNTNTKSSDYSELKTNPRPGHADYTAEVKYFGHQDYAGGGHFSGRLTAPLCVAGGICLQLLEREGISIISRIAAISSVRDTGSLTASTADRDFPVVNDECGKEMRELIASAKARGDSVGGIIECSVLGLPAGLGDPMFDGMENRISRAVFGIPAVKGIEFGAGFASASMFGSENNDPFCINDGKVETVTNNCGGILGGITNGMPLTFRVAIKPTPSVALPQQTVNLPSGEQTTLSVKGRHDPCIVPRAVPCVEAAAALAVYDALLGRRKELM